MQAKKGDVVFPSIFLPDIWEKHCVKVVTTNPDDSAVANKTDDTDAPTPAPAAAPHTMNTYKKDAMHSAIIDLRMIKNEKKHFYNKMKIANIKNYNRLFKSINFQIF